MPLTLPRLDDRSYDEILRETIARIPVHTPEWTNHNDSDPGITLLQLFAFMTENLLYRSNLIPERNRQKFLQLLNVPLRAASAAHGVVTIANQRGPLETVTLPAGVAAGAGRIGFVTTHALDILPVEPRIYYRRRLTGDEATKAANEQAQFFEAQTDDDTELEFYQTTPFEPPASAAAMPSIDLGGTTTVDRALWLALLARPKEDVKDAAAAIAERVLTLGLVPTVDDATSVLLPGGKPASDQPVPLIFEISTGQLVDDVPQYLELQSDEQQSQDLSLVQLSLPAIDQIGTWDDLEPGDDGVGDLPPALDDDDVRTRVVAWIRIRVKGGDAELPAGVKAKYTWVGLNATEITQRVEVTLEPVSAGTGEPDQRVTVVNTPVLVDSVRVFVGAEQWTPTDDLLAAGPEVPVRDPSLPPGAPTPPPSNPNVYTVDAESGEIRFGDGLRGRRPPNGLAILVSYAYGGGRAGNVGIGAVKTSPSLPPGFVVSNPLPTWGGAEGESVTEAEQSIPRVLRHSNRAVSRDDFADIVGQTPGIDLGRVEVLPLFHPDIGSPAPGVVTVMVIPVDPLHPEAPTPDQFFLQAVCEYLEPRRVLTSEVHVRGPEYVGVMVAVGIDVVPGRDIPTVREAVKAAIRQFLSPIDTGLGGNAWPLGKAVEDRELLVQAARVDGVAKVRQVSLWPETGDAQPTLELSGLQLPRLNRLSVTVGDADDLRAQDTTAGGTTGTTKPKRRLPVPTVPRNC
jgi:hypothetical protein